MSYIKRYKAIKYAGDDIYSWAVFRTMDIKGLRSPISEYCAAKPIFTGLDMHTARYEAAALERKWEEKNAM